MRAGLPALLAGLGLCLPAVLLDSSGRAQLLRPERFAAPVAVDLPEAAAPAPRSRPAQQHYLAGLIYYQQGDYGRAREEWTRAWRLDPGHIDARAGLERLAAILYP